MRNILIEHDDKQELFMMRISPEFQPREHNGDIWMTYEEAEQLHATLHALLKKIHEDTNKY